MKIVIAGGGIVGQKLAKALSRKNDVVLIDIERTVCETIAARYGVLVICGDATKLDTLIDAGVDSADITMGVMKKDAENLVFTLLSKNLGVEKIYVRMHHPEYREAYKMAGATNIGATVDLMVQKFISSINQPNIKRIAVLGKNKAELSIIKLPEKFKWEGKTVQEIVKNEEFPYQFIIAGVYDEEEDFFTVPNGNYILKGKLELFIVANVEDTKKLYNKFNK